MRKNCSGQFFLLPNIIFDERLSPNEFIVYSFLVRAKDSAGQSFWSVPMIAKSCSMCASTCRKVLRSLESGGYITISKRFIGKEYEMLRFGNFMIFGTKICGFRVGFERISSRRF